MNTRHLVDPQIASMLETFPPLELNSHSLSSVRQRLNEMHQEMLPTLPKFPNIEVTEHRVGPAGVRVLLYRPRGTVQPLPALLWIHGGGYVIGSADHDDIAAKTLASEASCVVASVDYRLAPETVFPGPVEDCYAGLKWLHDQAAELGVDSTRIAVGGASAGGGLAACLSLLARDRKEVKLKFQLLIYPMLDDRTVTNADPHPHTGEFIWTHADNRFGWSAMLGRTPGGSDVSPYAAASRATNLADLPSTYLCVGSLDLFLEEDMDYALRLTRAGVPTELHVYPGGFHGFNVVAEAEVSLSYMRDLLGALRRAIVPSA